MLENVKYISRVEQDILVLVRFAHSWDILVNTRNKFQISAHSYIILYLIFIINNVRKLNAKYWRL